MSVKMKLTLACVLLSLASTVACGPDAPAGTYTATIVGIKNTITFSGDRLETYNIVEGRRVFKYSISKDGTSIQLTDAVTGTVTTESFAYIREANRVILGVTAYFK